MGQKVLWQTHISTGSNARVICAPVRASVFGVGAPEALLVGVVALVVFGPKGLAQAARSLKDTITTFAPTIREITQVSTELKSTLEEEIGLNDLREEFQRPLGAPRPKKTAAAAALESTSEASSSSSGESLSDITAGMQQVDDTMAKDIDPEIERRREEAAKMAWGGQAPSSSPAAAASSSDVPLGNLSIEELEKELARRKSSQE
jgi:Sec-independent protein translocase protein TatA